MTKQDAIDWIRSNLPTKMVDGKEMVAREHDTDGDTECSICGRPHTPTVEYHPVEKLAEQYHDVIGAHLPDQAADAAHEGIEEAKGRGTGHERFFEQY